MGHSQVSNPPTPFHPTPTKVELMGVLTAEMPCSQGYHVLSNSMHIFILCCWEGHNPLWSKVFSKVFIFVCIKMSKHTSIGSSHFEQYSIQFKNEQFLMVSFNSCSCSLFLHVLVFSCLPHLFLLLFLKILKTLKKMSRCYLHFSSLWCLCHPHIL